MVFQLGIDIGKEGRWETLGFLLFGVVIGLL
jgi:hypothetical protein